MLPKPLSANKFILFIIFFYINLFVFYIIGYSSRVSVDVRVHRHICVNSGFPVTILFLLLDLSVVLLLFILLRLIFFSHAAVNVTACRFVIKICLADSNSLYYSYCYVIIVFTFKLLDFIAFLM